MTKPQASFAGIAADLRREFDRSFAAAPAIGLDRVEKFLALRIDDDPYAIRTSEIFGLFADRRVVPLPSSVPALLGVAGLRGTIATVYDLATLLGHPSRAAPRWLALVAQDAAVVLAFTTFEAQLVVSPRDTVAASGHTEARPFVRGALRDGDVIRTILDIPSVLREIQARAGAARATKRSIEQ